MSLVVVRALGLVTIQDLGRPGRMHEALAPGGALVPAWLIAANRVARNPDGAAAIEVSGQLVVRAVEDLELATERDQTPRTLRAGDELAIESGPRRCTYLAIRGGVDAPLVLGGRATQRSAGLGALLAANDQIAAARIAITEHAHVAAPRTSAAPAGESPIALIIGPDRDAFAASAFDQLVAGTYRVSPTSDRIGTRLDGPPLPRVAGYPEATRPMVRGAIEVPPDGAPIVLGPEHPTTGGYPLIGVIVHTELDRFFATGLGMAVRFRWVAGP